MLSKTRSSENEALNNVCRLAGSRWVGVACVWALVLAVAACAPGELGSTELGNAAERGAEVQGLDGPRADSGAPAMGLLDLSSRASGSSDLAAALGALPWIERVSLEQRLAEADERYAPQLDEGVARLSPPGALGARFEAEGAQLNLGDGAELSLGLSAYGRAGAMRAVEVSTPIVAGPRVELARGAGLVEWWRALPSGLEHGLTLEARPEGPGPLLLELAVTGARPEASSRDLVLLRHPESAAVLTHYGRLVVLDADRTRVPARIEVKEGQITLRVEDADARYPLFVDPLLWSEEATLLASDGAADDRLGVSVSLSVDGSRALVGAYSDDTAGGLSAGSARVFVRSGTSWIEEATLLASDGAAGDRLGESVSLSADGSRALVGVPFDDTAGGGNTGSARVFVRSGTSWSEEATLLASDGAAATSSAVRCR